MSVHELSFAKVTLHKDDLAEIIANEGVEINVKMVNELKNFISKNIEPPSFLLVNRINSYSYTFEAQQTILDLKNIHSIAFVTYSQSSTETSKLLTVFAPDHIDYEVKIFTDREVALKWLLSRRNDVS